MMGILAPQPFLTTFTGDASLHKRPMGRVIKPLSAMGAKIYGRENNTKLPITIVPAESRLHGMVYESPVASAQVKSAILLAGMYADGPTTVVEPFTSRDHTERMLEAFGVETKKDGTAVTIAPVEAFRAPEAIEVPGDISSAAYWLVAGSVVPGSSLLLKNVGVNPTRTGILDVLQAMGADISLQNERVSGGEEAAAREFPGLRHRPADPGGRGRHERPARFHAPDGRADCPFRHPAERDCPRRKP